MVDTNPRGPVLIVVDSAFHRNVLETLRLGSRNPLCVGDMIVVELAMVTARTPMSGVDTRAVVVMVQLGDFPRAPSAQEHLGANDRAGGDDGVRQYRSRECR